MVQKTITMPILMIASLAFSISVATASDAQIDQSTHRQVRLIHPEVDGQRVELHSITSSPDGLIIAAVGRHHAAAQETANIEDDEPAGHDEPATTHDVRSRRRSNAAILWMDSFGEVVREVRLDITPSAVCVAPDGVVFVGGSGKICQISTDGELVMSVDSPHVGDMKKLRATAIKSVRRPRGGMTEMFAGRVETLKERIGEIEKIAEQDRTRLQTAQLEAYQKQLDILLPLASDADKDESPEDEPELTHDQKEQVRWMVERSCSVTSIAASNQDVFLCGNQPGRGYQVWRIDRSMNADSATVVLSNLSGCCGQMDIQCCGDGIAVGENTKFNVAFYDRDGNKKSKFGKRDRSSREGFGSCCNPMNTLPVADGTILTAESSIGHIKKFDLDGNFLAYIGKADIGGGCKHCSLAYDAENDLYFMQSQDENAICVLANRDDAPVSDQELQIAESSKEFLRLAAGVWAHADAPKTKKSTGLFSLILGGRSSSSSSSMPISRIEVNEDGSASILAGQYAQYGDKSIIDVKKVLDDDAGRVRFGLSIDQVEFFTGDWSIDGDVSTIEIDGMAALKLTRETPAENIDQDVSDATNETCNAQTSDQTSCQQESCSEGSCSKESCSKESCEQESCEQETVSGERTATEMAVYNQMMSEAETAQTVITFDDPLIQRPTWQYKLIGVDQLGDARENALNRLGGEGWEYTGRLGEKLMFKRFEIPAATEGE